MQEASSIYYISNIDSRKRVICNDPQDYRELLRTFLHVKRRMSVPVLAFLLMPAAFHLVVECPDILIGDISDLILAEYNSYYRKKHGQMRHGIKQPSKYIRLDKRHEVIERIWHIWRIPIEAGLVEEVKGYKWSSYRLLGRKNGLIDAGKLASYMPINNWQLIACHEDPTWEHKLHADRMPDIEARRLICKYAATQTPEGIALLPQHVQGSIYKQLLAENVSIRQICDITHSNRYRVSKALAYADDGWAH